MRAEIKGTTMPVLEVTLQQGEQIISTHGELSWMTPNVQMSQTTGGGGGGGGGFMGSLKRVMGGGSLFLTRYEAASGTGMVAFAAKLPGHIMPVDINGMPFFVHRHGWLCGTPGITPSIGLQQTFRGGLWGGDGFLLQRLEGQGRAWIELSGELMHYALAPGQTLMVHPGHVGMFEGSVQFAITRVPGIANKLFGADGFHLVALTGPGQVWLQSMPLPILAHSLEPYIARQTDGQSAQAGAIGGIIGNMMRS
ncbi:MAG: AIM24 family protein [Streptosporangiaceae bacterium]|nr:AIM24 family protein [Streptosporangiaceae bacterium]MBV9854707.1 AIM24 family protein [Streptosporangiaceae bacterium]